MKNLFKFVGIIALVAIIGFGMVACKDDATEEDSIEGTWTGNMGGQFATVIISSSTWSINVAGFQDSGNFTKNGNTGTMYSSNLGSVVVGTASVKGNTITIILNSNSDIPGTHTLTRQ